MSSIRAFLRAAVAPAAPRLLPFSYNATAVRIVDGDTIHCDVAYTPHLQLVDWPVRLLGIAARALSEPGGPEAAAALGGVLPTGTPLALYLVGDYKYGGEWVADIRTVDAAGAVYSVCEWMVAQQWAAAWDGRGKQPKPPWPRTV